nr:nucleotidyltransferase domain-containing protein [uncultured Mucilaginibacter sp.]
MLHPIIQSQLPTIVNLFKVYRIKSAYAFGSVVGDNFNEKSDIDLLIDFEDGINALERGKIWWNLHDALRQTFNREVDLLVNGTIKNPYLSADIDEKKQLIYGA